MYHLIYTHLVISDNYHIIAYCAISQMYIIDDSMKYNKLLFENCMSRREKLHHKYAKQRLDRPLTSCDIIKEVPQNDGGGRRP